jgi:hypothetical protein
MKLISIFLTVILSGAVASAFPSVGDFAHYMTRDSSMGDYESSAEIIGYTATSETEGLFQIRQINYLNAGPDELIVEQLSAYLLSSKSVARYLQNCPTMGGVFATVTVPAGTFKTCRVTITGENYINEVYIADVSFGWAKMEFNSLDGHGGFTTVLKSFVSKGHQ